MTVLEGFPALLDAWRVPNAPAFQPRAVAEALGLEYQELARIARVHRDTVRNSPANPQLQRTLSDIVRVLMAATDVAGGDVTRAIQWFRTEPLRVFRYRMPIDVIADGETERLLDWMESLRAGALG